ncbi:7484_t:CDS:2 [Dentiscutata erythropus]|uniref:7484_t:CDS:1 n=1 Tax=Dentiscutata erythropus TaxID=1348616 RepID=A0A9N9B0D5_9GLOM|nr:7484_t:CDS:2 [Dentiscutata erythropus]
MPPKTTLTDVQKLEFCCFANENTMTRKKQLTAEIDNPNKRQNRSVTVPHFELAFKEFILTYQHRIIISEAMLIEKAKQLSKGLGIPEEVENEKNVKNLKIDILRGIRYIIKAWNKVKERTIYNCWRHTKILSNNDNEISLENNQEIEETDELLNLSNSIRNLNLSNSIEVVDFLAIPEEEEVCKIIDENAMMAEIIEYLKKDLKNLIVKILMKQMTVLK